MRVGLSESQTEIWRRFGELVNDELIPSIRRMSERPRRRADADSPAVSVDADSPAVSVDAAGAALAEDGVSVRGAVWRAMVDLGATRLLLPDHRGGEDAGQQGAVMLAELLGTALYQGPLFDTMIATELLALGGEAEGKRLGEIGEGAAVPVAVRESAHDGHARPGPLAEVDGPTIDASRRFVGFVPEAAYLLVVGRTPDGPRAALVGREHPTVSYRRHDDVTGGELYAVGLAGTPVLWWTPGSTVDVWPQVVARARIRHAAYLVGLCQGALDLTVARSVKRRQFGQPIGRFQALAFRLAELATRVEGARWLVRAAAWEADDGRDVRRSAGQALAMAADLARDTVLTAVQVHGAYGITEEADIQLYFRRAHVDRVWFGAPAEVRREVFPLMVAETAATHPRI